MTATARARTREFVRAVKIERTPIANRMQLAVDGALLFVTGKRLGTYGTLRTIVRRWPFNRAFARLDTRATRLIARRPWLPFAHFAIDRAVIQVTVLVLRELRWACSAIESRSCDNTNLFGLLAATASCGALAPLNRTAICIGATSYAVYRAILRAALFRLLQGRACFAFECCGHADRAKSRAVSTTASSGARRNRAPV